MIHTLTLLQKHHIDYNILIYINRTNTLQPLQIYNFLYNTNIKFIQFIPIIEHLTNKTTIHTKLKLHTPNDIQNELTK